MSKQQEALRIALEALRDYRRSDDDRISVAMGILQEALTEQPAQQQCLSNCDTCDHKANPDGGWCYMFREEPIGVCARHTPMPAQQQEDQKLVNLLCRIHRDGGHYITEHGLQKAVEVADLKIAELNAMSDAQQQEPVAWATRMGEYAHIHWGAKRPEYPMVYEVPLYTFPPASKPWVGLTQQERANVLASVPTVPFEGDWHLDLLTAIEAKLREKNS